MINSLLDEDKVAIKNKLTLLQVLDVAAREGNPDFVDLGTGDGGTSSIVFLFAFSDVTHRVFLK